MINFIKNYLISRALFSREYMFNLETKTYFHEKQKIFI